VTCKRMIHFMGKQELFKNKLVGAFFRAMGGFAVERGSGGGEAIENAIQLVKDGNVMCIFPEGTRSRDGKPMRAKSGVAVIASGTGEMVLPVAIYREGKIRPFCRATIRYGIPINASETKMQDGSRGELKRISGLIMDRIVELWKKGF
ncbi:MAG: lysophospholipid acyltransferase family protein, partial [Oscillospiraceae bacterium]